MFDSSYYKKRIIYRLEKSDYKAMIELNPGRRECYVFLPNDQKKGDYIIGLRDLDEKPLDPSRVEYLGAFLTSYGYTDYNFTNPFNRTKKIVNLLDQINSVEKELEERQKIGSKQKIKTKK